MTSNVQLSTMANLKAEVHEHLTCPSIKYDKEICICLPKSDLKISPANLVSLDENVSYLLTSVNLFERKKTLKDTKLTSWINC